ncbi:Glycosyltransferase involved in cell wall bisynthesis [Plantibacter flavus]|uniref:D-inositol 3-phosphate glycosyltransferase n=2 Tax=Plantibacter flavus TaxID=150123 RepID=A0A3N2C5C9_9MICO|nr:glycosyltransferase involved in cell wall biosynthesis [Plantibacter flavus]SMG39782.1 Glycosyltransferase involved in cell wall bisynthesis [Plantibacter flavus]
MAQPDKPQPATGPARARILVVIPWLQGGGAQGALFGLLRMMPRDRIDAVVLFEGNRHFDELYSLAAHVHLLDLPRSPKGILHARKAIRPLIKSSSSVYSLMRASHLVLGTLPRLELSDANLVATFHQLPSQDGTGLQGKVEDILVRRTATSAQLVTAPSRRAVAELRDRKFASNPVLERNRISIDSTDMAPHRQSCTDHVRLLFAGRLSAQKGLDRVARLLAATQTPVHLRIIGDGEDRPFVESLADKSHGHHVVEYRDHVRSVQSHLDWADASFLPSRWELNPLFVWESWARGRGVIASDIDVFQDLQQEGPLWTFSSPDTFAQVVRHLSASEALRRDAFDRGVIAASQLRGKSEIIDQLNR